MPQNTISLKIKKGLNLPYFYLGTKEIQKAKSPSKVAIAGIDYPIHPHLEVEIGSVIKRGQKVFTDREEPNVAVVSPVSGKVLAINRGEKRTLISILIQVDSIEPYEKNFFSASISKSNRKGLVNYLSQSGAWAYFRTRPFSLVPKTTDIPSAIFINGMDTRPGSCGMIPFLMGREKELLKGIEVALQLTNGKVYYCYNGKEWNTSFCDEFFRYISSKDILSDRFQEVSITGKHPAGLSSTHIHFLEPVSIQKSVWTIPAHLLADIGELFLTGILPNQTRVSLSGPYWNSPCILETTIGAQVTELVKDFLPTRESQNFRIISGSILYGWEASNDWDMLGRFHNQISILRNDIKREFMDWILPGLHKYSITRSTFGRFFPKNLIWNTSQNGSKRAMVPIGNYERVMPMDILPTQLLRALLTKDWEEAVELGALELEEEDLSLCTYVCPGKMDYGPMLKEILKTARKELL